MGDEIYNAYFPLFTLLSFSFFLYTKDSNLKKYILQIFVEENWEIIPSGNLPRVSEKLLNDTGNHSKTK